MPPLSSPALCHASTISVESALKPKVDSTEIVDAWHKAGLDNGGIAIEDPPGLRAQDRFSFYLAYLLDPAGNKICAMNVS
jgi:hypothetical protein